MYKLKIGDTVKIVLGKDKGKEGKIEKVYPSSNTVLVPGVNLFKKHVKPSQSLDGKGGIFDIPRPLSLGKVALMCPHCKKRTRVGFETKGGVKQRICRKCGKAIDMKGKEKK